jgi:hypothetical protein
LSDVNDIGQRVVAALGEPAAWELLEVLERSEAYRAALIGRLHVRDDAAWLAELLMDLEDEPGEIARIRLVDELRGLSGGNAWIARTRRLLLKRRGGICHPNRDRTAIVGSRRHSSCGAGSSAIRETTKTSGT